MRRSDQVRNDQAEVDEDGYELATSAADVIFTLNVEGTLGPDHGGKLTVKAVGRAPADSPLGLALANMPLSLVLGVPPFMMGLAGFLFVKIAWITAVMMVLGLAGAWFAWYLTRRRPPGSRPRS